MTKLDLIDQKFNKLTVISLDRTLNKLRYWKCECECGNITYVCTGALRASRIKSCGLCEINGPSKCRGPKKNYIPYNKISTDKLFTENRKFVPSIKERILKEKLIPYECECGNKGEWCGKQLILQLDHKDGNRYNNRLENLRFLCPNCHTQKLTWGRKRFKKLPSINELIELAKIKTNKEIANQYGCHPTSVSHNLRKSYK